ncbi:MAG: ABC transporter ATP-binding protein [Microvirga sp.]
MTAPRGARTSELVVRDLSHRYGGSYAVEDVSFEIETGETAALLGPSGCGKSTILRAIAGLIRPTSGAIVLSGRDLSQVSARARGIGMVFQNYALFPHLTVAENIAYPLACRGMKRSLRRERVAELLGLMRLDGYGRRLPRELSGGQQQRVAVARALAGQPALLLLDEPFGALDRALRTDLQVEMLKLQRSLGVTTLIVTHDQEEAQSLASRLILMNKGRIEQIDTPTAVYDRPKSLFVNGFIGHANRVSGTIERVLDGRTSIRLVTGDRLTLPLGLNFLAGTGVVVTCRPEDVAIAAGPGPNTIGAEVNASMPLGPMLVHHLDIGQGEDWRAAGMREAQTVPPSPGQRLHVAVDVARCHVFPAEGGSHDRRSVSTQQKEPAP